MINAGSLNQSYLNLHPFQNQIRFQTKKNDHVCQFPNWEQ